MLRKINKAAIFILEKAPQVSVYAIYCPQMRMIVSLTALFLNPLVQAFSLALTSKR